MLCFLVNFPFLIKQYLVLVHLSLCISLTNLLNCRNDQLSVISYQNKFPLNILTIDTGVEALRILILIAPRFKRVA